MNWIFQNQFFIFAGLLVISGVLAGWHIRELKKKIRLIMGDAVATDTDLQQDFIRRLTRIETIMESAEPRIARTEAASRMSVQKVGFRRFNPFQDTGGDNSFILVLLDHENNGVVLSSLYMRDGNRLYAKEVARAAARQPLSEEEKQVLEETLIKNA